MLLKGGVEISHIIYTKKAMKSIKTLDEKVKERVKSRIENGMIIIDAVLPEEKLIKDCKRFSK